MNILAAVETVALDEVKGQEGFKKMRDSDLKKFVRQVAIEVLKDMGIRTDESIVKKTDVVSEATQQTIANVQTWANASPNQTDHSNATLAKKCRII